MKDVKNLLLKFRYLKNEYQRASDIVTSAQREFFNRIATIQKNLNVFDPALDDKFSPRVENTKEDNFSNYEDDHDEPPKKDEKPGWAKKLFRKIATITHPDKIPETLGDDVKKQFLTFYKTATEAYEKEEFLDLLDIGSSLGVDLSKIGKIDTNNIRSEVKNIEKEIQNLKSSFYWGWWHATDKKKSELIKEFIKERGWETARSQSKKSRSGHPGKSISWSRKNKS